MWGILGTIASKVLGLFGKKLDNDKQKNQNATEIRKQEVTSPDIIVRRYRFYILLIIIIAITAEIFGVRLWIIKQFNIDPNSINFEKILDIYANILANSLTGE